MVGPFHENHLTKLLLNFDRNTYFDYMLTTGSAIEKVGDSISNRGQIIRSPDLGGNLAYRLRFELPIYITLSHPICRFRTHHNYPVRQYSYFANIGLVPIYFASLNRISVLKLYGDRTENFFSPISQPISNEGIDCWEFTVGPKPVEYSSMNFLIQHQSAEKLADVEIADVMNKYFTYAFWNWDNSKFNTSTHILHTRERVTSVVNVRKTLCVLQDLGKKYTVALEGHSIECVEAQLKILSLEGGSFKWEYTTALIDLQLSEEMSARENKFSFLNAIITDILTSGGRKITMLTVVADYGNSHFDILLSFIGIISWKTFLESKSTVDHSDIMMLKEKVYDLVIDAQHEIDLPYTLSNQVQNTFEIALESLFPILVMDSKSVLFTHPLCISFLKSWGFPNDSILNESFLKEFLCLLAESASSRTVKLYTSDHIKILNGLHISRPDFVKSLIRFYRLLDVFRSLENIVVS